MNTRCLGGPLAGYTNQPQIMVEEYEVGHNTATTRDIDLRPPQGQVWSPTYINVFTFIPFLTAGSTYKIYVGYYNGTQEVWIGKSEGVMGTSIASFNFGSSSSGPIRSTHDKWIRVHLEVNEDLAGKYVKFHVVLSIDRVI